MLPIADGDPHVAGFVFGVIVGPCAAPAGWPPAAPYTAGVSAYAVQQCLFDQLRRWSEAPGTEVTVDGYDLSCDEANAIAANDIGALYALGVHPVLLNGWCRATGHTRDDYKRLLAPYRRTTTTVPRWRTSS